LSLIPSKNHSPFTTSQYMKSSMTLDISGPKFVGYRRLSSPVTECMTTEATRAPHIADPRKIRLRYF
jgi:hypothetical protein